MNDEKRNEILKAIEAGYSADVISALEDLSIEQIREIMEEETTHGD